MLAWCSMLHSHKFDIQHDYFQGKNESTIDLTPGVEVVCKDRIAALVILFNLLLCDLAIF